MRHSISREFAILFSVILTVAMVAILIINSRLLPRYYLHKKIDVLHVAYEEIGKAAENESYDSSRFREELERICNKSFISVCVVDTDSQIKYVSRNGGSYLEEKLVSYIFGIYEENADVIEEGDDYVIWKTGMEGKENIEMYGRISDRIYFIMTTPVENIKESARIAHRFMLYVVLTMFVASVIFIGIIFRKITKPILEMSRISERMVNLDFSAKFRSKQKGKNEISLLGENINKLSDSLEKSISGLKTANNELQNDIRRKEQIDEMRREFLSNVSHELKTPIALIQGYAEGLMEDVNDDPESRKYYCEVIVDEASKMNKMVMKLLTLNQLEFGNDEISMERVDISALLHNYLQSAQLLVKKNGIELKFADYKPEFVWTDEFKVEEVVTNYFSNAVNHCETVDGRKQIEVKIETREEKVRVSVFNTGKPIPDDAIEHIWDKFYKVDKARTREYGGNGVGLSIVKAIMNSLNQGYGVENYSNGVLFWFEVERVNKKIQGPEEGKEAE